MVRADPGPPLGVVPSRVPQGASLPRPVRHDPLCRRGRRAVPRLVPPPREHHRRRMDTRLLLLSLGAATPAARRPRHAAAPAAPGPRRALPLRSRAPRPDGIATRPTAVVDAIERGFYNRLLDGWLAEFDRDQLLVLQYERCVADRETELERTFRHLGLEPRPPSPEPRPSRERPGPRAGLDDEVRALLVDLYAPDVAALAARLPDLDLAAWPNFAYLASGAASPGSVAGENSPTERGIAGVLAHPPEEAVPQARARWPHVRPGRRPAAGGAPSRRLPDVPARPPVPSNQGERIARVVVAPPRLRPVGRAPILQSAALCPRRSAAPRPAGRRRRRPARRTPPRAPCRRSRSPRGRRTIRRSGSTPASATARDNEGRAPAGHVDLGQVARRAGLGDDVDGVGTAADEDPAVGDHRSDRSCPRVARAEPLDPFDADRQPRRGQPKRLTSSSQR